MMQIGKKVFVFVPGDKAIQRDIRTLTKWCDSTITTGQARATLCRNNDHKADYITDDEFVKIAHSLGYWHKVSDRETLEEFRKQEQM